MDAAHVHLALNHFPVIGAIIAILLLGYALLKRSDEITRAGLALLFLVGTVAIPVFITGEPAEQLVEHLPGVSEQQIGQHESYANYAFGIAVVTGLAGLISLIFSFLNKRKAKWLVVPTFFLALIAGGLMLATANLGGQIRHREIRDTGAAAQPVRQNEPEGEKKGDDD